MIKGFDYSLEDEKIFNEEFAWRLPDEIIDSHAHCWDKACLKVKPEEYAKYKLYKPWTDFDLMEEFTMEDFQECSSRLFPGKKYRGVFFGLPFPEADRTKCNEFIIREAALRQAKFYYIPGQFENAWEAQERYHLLEHPGFMGWKPYPDLAVPVKGKEVRICDMLPESFLEMAHEKRLSIVLHLPGKKRLHSIELKRELENMIQKWKNANFIIAHAGRAFCYCDIEGIIDFLLDKENVWFDTALLNDPAVLEYLFSHADSEKILFGSDAPLAFTKGKDVCINNRHYYVAGEKVPWGLGPGTEGMLDLTYYLYEELRAVLYASRKVYGKNERDFLNRFFCKNFQALLTV